MVGQPYIRKNWNTTIVLHHKILNKYGPRNVKTLIGKGFLPVQVWIISLQIIWTGEVIFVILTSGTNQSQAHQYQAESIRHQKKSLFTVKKMKSKSFFTANVYDLSYGFSQGLTHWRFQLGSCMEGLMSLEIWTWLLRPRFYSMEISTWPLCVATLLRPTHILFILPGSQQHTEACG